MTNGVEFLESVLAERTQELQEPLMLHREDDDKALFRASKDDTTIRFPRDVHPEAQGYLVIQGPGFLVLFPEVHCSERLDSKPEELRSAGQPDHDAQLRRALDDVGSRIPRSAWSTSPNPQDALISGFRALQTQSAVRDDVTAYLMPSTY
jgi:hypothetical protein